MRLPCAYLEGTNCAQMFYLKGNWQTFTGEISEVAMRISRMKQLGPVFFFFVFFFVFFFFKGNWVTFRGGINEIIMCISRREQLAPGVLSIGELANFQRS